MSATNVSLDARNADKSKCSILLHCCACISDIKPRKKEKSLYLTSVVPSVTRLVSMEADGVFLAGDVANNKNEEGGGWSSYVYCWTFT